MQTTMALEDIKLTLPELLDSLTPGDEVILTRNQQPVAKLVSESPQPASKQRPGPGLGKGMITFIAPDFDAPLDYLQREPRVPGLGKGMITIYSDDDDHLKDFAEYMP